MGSKPLVFRGGSMIHHTFTIFTYPMSTEYHNMDFNYNDDDGAAANGGDANGGGDGGDYEQHQSPSNNGRPAPLETQMTNLSMPKKKSSVLGASSNLVNSIVGEK